MGTAIVTYTQIKQWRFCRQAYYYRYVEGLSPKLKPKPLKIGGIAHDLIASWCTGEDPKRLLQGVKNQWKMMFEEEREYYGNVPRLAEHIINGYIKLYAAERKRYSHVEETFGPIPLTNRVSFKFRIDRLRREERKGKSLCETKTGRKVPEEGVRIWDLQTLLYVWGLREVGIQIDSILWDYIRTKEPTEPTLLKDGSLSQKSIDTTYDTYMRVIQENKLNPKDYADILKSLKGNWSKFFKRVFLPVNEQMIEPVIAGARRTSLEMLYLMDRPVRSMSGFTCPRCQYQPLCYAALRGLDEEFVRGSEFKVRKQKEEHEEEVEEESGDD